MRTLGAWMPMRTEVENRFEVFHVEEEAEEDISQVEMVSETVEITVDSGAARSVWPRKKKGVKRQRIQGRKPKLAAANGTDIEVDGEAVLEFANNGRRCGMKFLDADVKKPLGAVSAMVDEGNTVVFSRRWGNYVENDVTKERIPMVRKGGTYTMTLESVQEKTNEAKNKGKKEESMEIGANEDEEDTGEETVVFRRRVL